MNFFDFHTHLDFYSEKDFDLMTSCIIESKIKVYSASVNIESFNKNEMIKEKIIKKAEEQGLEKRTAENLVSVTFGVHPSYCKNLPVKENEAIKLLTPYYEKSCIISECGLDFYWEKECSRETQLMHLLIALDIADRNKKVIVLHTKGAEKEILQVLNDFPGARPVIHWYDGPENIYKQFIERGYPQTFGCELKYSEAIRNFLKMTPRNLVLPETDNPTGEPWLGGTDSSPLLIKRIYEDISQVWKTDLEETCLILNENLYKYARL